MTDTLFDQPIDEIQVRFNAFDQANPRVWELFQQYAAQARSNGLAVFSADMILHRIRWFVRIETKGGQGFKINDHYSSRYARKLMESDPTFDGFFRLKTLAVEKAERNIA